MQWPDDALADLEQQVVHIARDKLAAARQVAKRIRETGNGLGEFATGHPGRGRRHTYEKSVNRLPYVVAYALDHDDTLLTILHVIHISRNWLPGDWPG